MGLMIGRLIRAFGADDVALPGRKFKERRFLMIANKAQIACDAALLA